MFQLQTKAECKLSYLTTYVDVIDSLNFLKFVIVSKAIFQKRHDNRQSRLVK